MKFKKFWSGGEGARAGGPLGSATDKTCFPRYLKCYDFLHTTNVNKSICRREKRRKLDGILGGYSD